MSIEFSHPEYLVRTDWLAQNLNNPNVVVLDCTTHLIPNPKITYDIVPGRKEYEEGHILGAQFIDLSNDLSDTSHKFRFMRQSPESFATAIGRFGVGEHTKVILYSMTSVQWASRVWWLLREFGHDNAAVLDGGFTKWNREGRPIETGPSSPRPPHVFKVRQVRNLMADAQEVLDAIGDTAICTLNALRPEQHAGSGGNTYGRPGRIKGSVNLPAGALIDPDTGCFLSAEKLHEKFASVGALDKKVITYCGGGIAASADALALVMLGNADVKLYDASMSEWAKDAVLPMEIG
ncbi:MAG: sulfurtransferase [Acetobacteraceae bacterium]|nr:sulfurtransferase [Acetobacteraceae bacterium]